MSSGSSVPDARQALERVLASRSFARAEQLRRLLFYLVEAALDGHEDTIKESVIGVDIFDLPADFDPKQDPIVRMGMRRLRSRLQQYYRQDGIKDPVVISLEPGCYVPRFITRGTVQNEIVAEVEKEALADLGQREQCHPVNPPPQGLYRLLLQGRHYLNGNTAESLKKSAQCFTAAIEKHPASASAWAGLSVAQIWMAMYHLQPAEQTWRRAAAAAEKAVNLDGTLPEARLALGLLAALSRFKPVEAGHHFAVILSAAPANNMLRLANAVTHLTPLGRLQEADDQVQAVLASDPLHPKALQMMALIAYFERQYERAAELCLSVFDIVPRSIVPSFILANCYERLGNTEEAVKQFRKCEEMMPFFKALKCSSVVAAVYKGRTKWIRPAVLAATRLLQASPRAASAMIADVLIRLGENEQAIKWMQRAFREKAFRALFLAVDPAFEPILSDGRCAALLRQLQESPSDLTVG